MLRFPHSNCRWSPSRKLLASWVSPLADVKQQTRAALSPIELEGGDSTVISSFEEAQSLAVQLAELLETYKEGDIPKLKELLRKVIHIDPDIGRVVWDPPNVPPPRHKTKGPHAAARGAGASLKSEAVASAPDKTGRRPGDR